MLYYKLFINLCAFLVLFTLLHTSVLKISDSKNIIFINFTGYTLLFILIVYIGLRPLYVIFGDTMNYAVGYKRYASGGAIINGSDYGFQVFMKFISNFGTVHLFFLICTFIYIYPIYRISKKLFNEYWYYSFIFFIVSFSFWTYGVNGLRNGMACSLFLWGISYRHNLKIMIPLFLVAISFHKTAALPILAYIITSFYNNPKFYLKGWLLCIPLSLAMGGVWVALFASLGFDDRLSGYLSEDANGSSLKTGFRWDFLFHSAFAVFAGWYFIYKKKFNDVFYFRLLNTYLICNGFWVLVIKANYSNRFAYLSWFMMAIVIIYPFLKSNHFKNNHLMIGKVMFAYFSFTYLMYYLYY